MRLVWFQYESFEDAGIKEFPKTPDDFVKALKQSKKRIRSDTSIQTMRQVGPCQIGTLLRRALQVTWTTVSK